MSKIKIGQLYKIFKRTKQNDKSNEILILEVWFIFINEQQQKFQYILT